MRMSPGGNKTLRPHLGETGRTVGVSACSVRGIGGAPAGARVCPGADVSSAAPMSDFVGKRPSCFWAAFPVTSPSLMPSSGGESGPAGRERLVSDRANCLNWISLN